MSTNQSESIRDIARLASQRHDGGGGRTMQALLEGTQFHMVRTTFDKILAGTYTSRPSRRTLDALAHLAGIPAARVYKAAGRDGVKASFTELLPPDIDELNDDQRNAVIGVARAFLKSNLELQGMRNELSHRTQPQPSNVINLPSADAKVARANQKTDRAAHKPDPKIAPDKLEDS